MTRVVPRTVVAAALAVLVLAGCTGGDDEAANEATEPGGDVGSATGQPAEPDPTAMTEDPTFTFGEADVAYLRQVIPSHDQAIAVTRLVTERTEREDFRQLAADTLAFREEQLAQLVDLAAQAGVEVDPADHAAVGDAPTVVPDAEVAALDQAEPGAFDVAAADVLARIDEGVVAIADETLATAEHPDVIVAAIDGIDRFEPEAATLRTWIGTWGG